MQHAIAAYYAELERYEGLDVTHETAVRSAMQTLLGEAGRNVGWTLVPEYRLPNGRRADGALVDPYRVPQGYWEAKDTRDNLEEEIKRKFALGYPHDNIVFEDTRRAVLYQGKANRAEFDLRRPNELRDLLQQFTAYNAPDHERFGQAVREFQTRIPDLANGLRERIETERQENRFFAAAFAQFHELCRTALNPGVTAPTIDEMLIQHLLTERLFRTIFDNPDFTRRNVIAHEIEKVIDALTRRAFNRQEFLRSLDRFYVPIENAGRTITDWSEKQGFLNAIYERFFQGFSTKQADTHGIVYTPQEIVAFMCASVEHLLKTEFGSSLSAPGVKILDPATGTGNFIVNLLKHHISRRDLRAKYADDLFANEIMLLPYYIASLNIEHEYYALTGEYAEFSGLCFADTLSLAEGEQMALFEEANADRTQRQQDTPITVIIGNPPYNVGQQNENDNNKNRPYKVVDARIAATYAKASKASNKNALSDAYVKFFRWATDRLGGRDGIVCFVSNNGFLHGIGADGMRKVLADEFTTIYHLDCGGNVRKNPRLSGTTHNVFGIQVGVGITILVQRKAESSGSQIHYHALPTMARASEKLQTLASWGSIADVPWQALTPNAKGDWITEGLQDDFDTFLPLGTKEGKAAKSDANVLFRIYGRGVATSRDSVVYDFNRDVLEGRVRQFIDAYNAEVDRYVRGGRPKDIDGLVAYDKVNWSRDLKLDLQRGKYATFAGDRVRAALYRPFCKSFLFFDRVLNEEVYTLPSTFPIPATEQENVVICLTDAGSEKPFMALAANHVPDLHIVGAGSSSQCFPFYVYDEDGTNRRENLTDWALEQFRNAHGPDVTKQQIFAYVYALLHDPAYRKRYAENLKRALPRIPLEPRRHGEHGEEKLTADNTDNADVHGYQQEDKQSSGSASYSPVSSVSSVVPSSFRHYADVGALLLRLHLDYEQAAEYRLDWIENRDVPFSWRVERMRLSKDRTQMSKDRTQIVVNESLTLAGVPSECFAYRLGNRSALEWVLDQYQVTTDKRSGLVSDPNRPDDPEYIVRLVSRVITVSLETVRLVASLTTPESNHFA